MKKLLLTAALAASLLTPFANAADYIIDHKGAHASINFKIKHLGYSWLTGRFDDFNGRFSYDRDDVAASKLEITINTNSVNSNHKKRDKHLRGKKYLNSKKFGQAKFVSTEIKSTGGDNLAVTGTLTLHGVSKPITINAYKVGEGKDPWGGYRVGFSGTTRIAMKDFAIEADLGPDSTHVELELHIEGIRQ